MKPGRLFLILILAAALSSCSSFLISFFGYGQRDIKDNCITPEPGTTVSVRCRLITEIGRDYFSIDSKEILLPRQKLLQKFKPSIRSTKDLSIRSGHDSIRLRLYCNIPKHKRAGLPVILYIHGGGFVRGSIDNFEGYCVKIAKKTGGLVVSVDYHLAPENPFPCAVCDCYNALKWTAANCESYGGSDRRIIVMGGSAGGNLAAVMPIVCRDSCGPSISGQVLCYPSTSLRHTK